MSGKYPGHQKAAAAIYGVLSEPPEDRPSERLYLDKYLESQKFFIDPVSLPVDMTRAATDFGRQLSSFGLAKLPFPTTSVFWGPIQDDEVLSYYWAALLWQEGEEVFGRVYSVRSDTLIQTSFATLRLPKGVTAENMKPSDRRLDFERAAKGPEIEIDDTTHKMLITMFALLVGALGCRGASITAPKVAPRWLNAERAKKGKPPIISYHTLAIDLAQARLPGIRSVGGSHASPRLHWRRGHIRNLANGKVSIVSPCLVGSPERGIVHKDYALAA